MFERFQTKKKMQYEVHTYEDILRHFGYAMWTILLFWKHMLFYEVLISDEKKMPNKVDFGDFRFLHIKPKAVRYVSGVATAILGSGGMLPSSLP